MQDAVYFHFTNSVNNLNMDRRKFVQKTAVLGAGTMVAGAIACQSMEQTKSLDMKRILFVYGGWPGHAPDQCRDLYVPWLESQGAIVTTSETLKVYEDATLMSQVDLIIQVWTMGEISQPQIQGLMSAVQGGAGLAGWHGGLTDAFRATPEFAFMTGGSFTAHPGGFVPYKVYPVDHEDDVMQGIQPYDINTEQYYMHVDPNVRVLATTKFTGEHHAWLEGCIMPVVWKKMFGNGRVFYSAIGHKMEDHSVDQTWKIMTRGIQWAAKSRTEGPEQLVSPVYSI